MQMFDAVNGKLSQVSKFLVLYVKHVRHKAEISWDSFSDKSKSDAIAKFKSKNLPNRNFKKGSYAHVLCLKNHNILMSPFKLFSKFLLFEKIVEISDSVLEFESIKSTNVEPFLLLWLPLARLKLIFFKLRLLDDTIDSLKISSSMCATDQTLCFAFKLYYLLPLELSNAF